LTIAVDTGNSDDFTLVDIEAYILDPHRAVLIGDLKVFQAQHHPARLLLGFLNLEFHRSAYHHFCKILLTDILYLDRPDTAAASKDGATVCDFLYLLKLVGYQYYGFSFRTKFLENVHQLIDFLRSQDGGRFIENNDIRIAIECFENFHTLLLPDGDVLDQ